jgi:hypothetical protein
MKLKKGWNRSSFRGRNFVVAVGAAVCLFNSIQGHAATVIPLDGEWRFHPVQVAMEGLSATATERAQRFGASEFNDSSWSNIVVPGYWDQPSGARPWSNPAQTGGPFPNHDGEAWYRREFSLPRDLFQDPEGKPAAEEEWVASLEFEGVAALASVWLNGTFIGRHVGAFAPFEFQIPPQTLRSATNVLSIRVRDKTFYHVPSAANPNSTAQIPLGFDRRLGGIWRPLRLKISPKERLTDVSLVPTADSVTAQILVSPEAVDSSTLTVEIVELATNKKIYGPRIQPILPFEGHRPGLTLLISNFPSSLRPKTWSPEDPNLYVFKLILQNSRGGEDRRDIRFGFRDFRIEGNRFLLNGRPYFLLGAGSPPHYENPPREVARRHLEMLKEAGVRMVRFAHEPPSPMWLDLCDEIGLLAWIEGALSADDGPYDFANRTLVSNATEEMTAVVRQLENHPSATIWSIGSGNLRASQSEESRETARHVLSLIAEMVSRMDLGSTSLQRIAREEVSSATLERRRITLPESDARLFATTPIEDWQTSIGWYYGKTADWKGFLETVAARTEKLNLPWVSSEIETGYSTASQGRIVPDPIEEAASRMRIGLPGEERDPLLEYQAERIRRMIFDARAMRNPETHRIAGLFPFTSSNWFFNPMTPSAMQPKPVLKAIEQAYQPVLLALELPRIHFYQNDPRGEIPSATVTVVNDRYDNPSQPSGTLTFEVVTEGQAGSTVTQRTIPPVPYYENAAYPFYLTLPETPALSKAEVRVRLTTGENVISETLSNIVIGSQAECLPKPEDLAKDVLIYDPANLILPILETFKIRPKKLESLDQLSDAAGLWIGPEGFDDYVWRAWPLLKRWISAGGRVWVSAQSPAESRWQFNGPYPGNLELAIPEGWASGIDTVNIRVEDHPLFANVKDGVLSQWGNDRVIASHVLRPIEEEAPATDEPYRFLADVVPSEETLRWDGAVAEVSIGEGKVILSQMFVVHQAQLDPITGLVLRNLCKWLGGAARPILADLPESATPFLDPLVGNGGGEVRAPRSGIGQRDSIRAVPVENALFDVVREKGLSGSEHTGVMPKNPRVDNEGGAVYYDLDDRFWYKTNGQAQVEVQVYCREPSEIRLDYDSSDATQGSLAPYKPASAHSVLETGVWKVLVFSLPDAYFGGRQPGNSDFRLVTTQGRAVYGPLVVRKVKKESE